MFEGDGELTKGVVVEGRGIYTHTNTHIQAHTHSHSTLHINHLALWLGRTAHMKYFVLFNALST